MPKLSDEQQAIRRTRILDAAEACFARAGFHRTTMQDICREARISAGALYVYFGSKEALIEGLVDRDRADILQKFELLPLTGDFSDGLAAVLRACIVEATDDKSRLFVEINAEASRNPAVAAIVGRCDEAIRASLEELIGRAIEDNRIAPVLSARELSALMMVVADGLFFRKGVSRGFDCAALAPHVIAMLGGPLNARDPAPSKTTPEQSREPVHDV